MPRPAKSRAYTWGDAVEEKAEAAAAFFVGAAVVLVPIALSTRTTYPLDIKRPILGTCAILAGLALLVRWAAGGRLVPKTAAMARVLGLFLCVVGVSLAFSRYRAVGWRQTGWYAANAILFIAAAVVSRKREWATVLLVAILAAATLVAISGWLQAFGIDLYDIRWLKRGQPIRLGEKGVRVLGTIGLETALGGYMATCSVLAIGVAFVVQRVAPCILAAVAAALMIACMILSGARTAWLGFLVGLVMLALSLGRSGLKHALRPRAGKLAAGLIAAALVAAAVVWGSSIVARVSRLPSHLATRTTIWRAALGMAYDRPVVGQGPGTFRICFADFRPSDYARYRVGSGTLFAHCEYLEVLAETGVLGLSVFALFLGLFVMASCRALKSRPAGRDRALLAAALAATVALLVQCVASVSTRYPTCQMTLWVMLGLTVARWESGSPAPARRRGASAWRLAVVAAAAAIAPILWTTEVYRPYLAREHLRRMEESHVAGAWPEAVDSAWRAVALDPASIPSHDALGNSLFYAGHYGAALAAFDTLRDHSPHHADVHLRTAVLYARLGRVSEARQALRLARRYGMTWARLSKPELLTDQELRAAALEFEKKEKNRVRRRG